MAQDSSVLSILCFPRGRNDGSDGKSYGVTVKFKEEK